MKIERSKGINFVVIHGFLIYILLYENHIACEIFYERKSSFIINILTTDDCQLKTDNDYVW